MLSNTATRISNLTIKLISELKLYTEFNINSVENFLPDTNEN
jgi:hypothetical protein